MIELLQFCPGDRYVAWMLSVLVQATAVLAIAWGLASVLARRNAAARYATWLVSLALVLMSPMAGYLAVSSRASLVELSLLEEFPDQPVAAAQAVALSLPESVPASLPESPRLPLANSSDEPSYQPVPGQQTFAPPPSFPEMESTPAPALSADGEGPALPTPASWSRADYLRIGFLMVSVLWAGGIVCLAIRFAWRARRLSLVLRETRQLEIPQIEHMVRDICQGLGLRKTPELRSWVSPDATLAPITVGAIHPIIVFSPAIFRSLPADRLRNALVHECAHVLRHDVLVAIFQRIAVMGFWPHPLVWLMDRGLSRAREEICDNYVLRDTDGTDYSRTLLDIGERLQPAAKNLAHLGLFERPWRLEQRIAGLLDANRVRLTRIRPLRALVLCGVLLAVLSISGGIRFLVADSTAAKAVEEDQALETTEALSVADDPAAHDQELVRELGLQSVQSLEDGRINAVALGDGKLTTELVQELKGFSALNGLMLVRSSVSDGDLMVLRELATIETLWLSGTYVTPSGVSHLKHLGKLTRLYVSGPEFTDGSLALLADMPQLEFLGFSGTDVTSAGLGNLKRFPNLKSVMFQRNYPLQNRPGKCVITDAELEILAEIPTLTSVTLGMGCNVTDQGMATLARLSQLEELSVHGGNITDAGLDHIKSLSQLKRLRLEECRWFTDVGLEHLRGLTLLEDLSLSNGEFTDVGMAHLEPLRNLNALNLRSAQLSHVGLAHLRPLTKLKFLVFLGMTYTDAGLEIIGGLTQLESLFLTGHEISDTGLGYLKNLTKIKYLILQDTSITGAGLVNLARMQDLQNLSISNAAIGDASLAYLANLRHLQSLELRGTLVGDQGLESLSSLQELTNLELSGTQITDAGMAAVGRLPRLTRLGLWQTGISDTGAGASKKPVWTPGAKLISTDLSIADRR